MASKYYGVNVGKGMAGDVATGSSTTSRPIELVVDKAATGLTKMDVLKAIEAIEYAVTQDTFPLA